MNMQCPLCGKRALYWNTIIQVMRCHACRINFSQGSKYLQHIAKWARNGR